jgi:penicillin-binding protein 1A
MSKTGTTNDSRTCWYIGSTPTLTTAVYVGFDDNRSMGQNVYPIRTAFPFWLKFNRAVESTEKTFSYDPSLQEYIIDERTGEPSVKGKPGAISILI